MTLRSFTTQDPISLEPDCQHTGYTSCQSTNNAEAQFHAAWHTTTSCFTISRTRDMTSPSPFLALPGELRNKIYTEVAHNASSIKLFEGRVVLPPLAGVCRQVRREMSGNNQAELYLDPAAPIHAHVTNFNFHPLLRWLNAHRQHLKGEAPRLLVITSVLLAPDFATGIFDPEVSKEKSDRQSSDKAYNNSLRILMQNLESFEPYFEAWRDCDIPDEVAWGDEARSLLQPSLFDPGRARTAEIAGTRFLVCCRAQTIHRNHPASLAGHDGTARKGFCFRGDHCDRFRNYASEQNKYRSIFGLSAGFGFFGVFGAGGLEKLINSAMKGSHNASSHKKWRRDFPVQSTPHERELAKIYRRLDKANSKANVESPMMRKPSSPFFDREKVGAKRARFNIFFGGMRIPERPPIPDETAVSYCRIPFVDKPPKKKRLGDAWYECHRLLGYRLKRNFDWSEEEEEQRRLFDIELRRVIERMECLYLGDFPRGQ